MRVQFTWLTSGSGAFHYCCPLLSYSVLPVCSIWQVWRSQGSSWSLALYRLFSKEYEDPSAKSADNPLKVLSQE